MRKIYYLLALIWITQLCRAQPTRYGNEWVDYTPGHQYYKIKITADGFYHIPFALLDSVVQGLSAINPANFVMYHNGTAVPIYVSATGTSMGASDYIEFYGKKNIGDVDSVLYPKPGYQPDIWYSLFSDTSIYFLTTKTTGNNSHYTFANNDTASIPSLTEDLYYLFSAHTYYTPASPGKFSGGVPFYTGTDYLYKSLYDDDEAWGGGWINVGAPFTATLNTPLVYTAGPPATVNANIFTRSYEPHNIVTTFNGNPLQTFTFDNTYGGLYKHLISQSMPLSNLVAANALKVQETGTATSGNQNLLMCSEIIYPHKYDFGGANQQFWLMAGGSGERFFRVNNIATTTAPPLLYDITNGYIIRSTDAPGVLPKKFVLPAAIGNRELFIRTDDPSSYTVIGKMDTITFQNYAALQSSYMVITNKILRHDSVGNDYVQLYANYRDRTASPSTGIYDAKVYDIDQIIDQFGYGVRKTPLAVRNFVEYAYDKWAEKPQYLFIIAKGRDYMESRTTSYIYDHNLVTPFGRYPSDNLLVCRRGSNRPLIPIGRLAAQTTYDVYNYLNKMTLYEHEQSTYGDPYQTKENKLWMKQIMHFSGGSTGDEQTLFAQYLSDFANIAQDTSWGAHVFTIYKTTSAPVDNSESDLIRAHIDSGASLLTFFGHAAGTTFDISVDDPTNWTNYGKYPVIYSNGCQSGDISSVNAANNPPLPSYSEEAVLTPNKCAIAFTATSYLSVSTGLYNYGLSAYGAVCQNAYDKPWGKALQLAQIAQDSLNSGDDYTMMAAYEMTLHGDPALTLNQYTKPDYQVDQNSLYFTPSVVTPSTDSILVSVIVTNLGKAIKDSIQITLSRSYPNPSDPSQPPIVLTYVWKVRATYYQDTFNIKVPTVPTPNAGFGQNEFTVFVESEQRIAELSETNNGAGIQYGLFIESDDVLPIYPYNYSILPSQNPILKASTVDPFAPLKTYRIQIDTSELFKHPLAQTTIRQVGGVLHWSVPISFKDSTVYYWRVSRDSINDTLSYNWHYSSFVYIKNEYPGWNQSHYYQYGHDYYPGDSVYLATDRAFKYAPINYPIHVGTGWADAVGHGPVPYSEIEWDVNGVPEFRYNSGGCGYANPYNNGGFTFAVIDTATGNIWNSTISTQGQWGSRFGNYQCTSQSTTINGFDFGLSPTQVPPGYGHTAPSGYAYPNTWSQTIRNFLDSIPNGSIIIMYSVDQPQWSTIDPLLIQKLVSMGATGLTLLQSGAHAPAPYVFFCHKGNPSSASQVIGTNYLQKLNAYYSYSVLVNKGSYQSPTIGPSTKWGSFHWRWRSREARSDDKQSVDIVGIQNNGNQVTLLNTQALDTTLSFINPALYPYLKLVMHTEDDTTHTPSQLYYWRVLFNEVPEAAINPAAHFYVQRDTLSLGDTLNVEVALENVTKLPMDSMRTLYTIQGSGQNTVLVKSDSLRALQTQILKFRYPLASSIYSGKDKLVIEANPQDALHQPEEYHFNNFAVVPFVASGDNVNPLLDVTFDGRRILNNDLVSAKPDVLISMKDENKTLALNDTSLAQVYIRYPGQTVPTLINYDNSILTFYPATGNISKNNTARIEFKPTFTTDGTYDLLVRDKDRSGNYSSNTTNRYQGTAINGVYYDYKISFNIITKSMITNVLNYPNPFSTRTQFVFTLTGSEVPDYMKIQIMTITGKVVKEVQRGELGNIHVGLNRTDYYWDGRDEYGDKLANGVYFYRVITKIDDKNVDHMSSTQYGQFFNNTNIDKYFKDGFGKLVIMR
jgi:hypothetical protein